MTIDDAAHLAKERGDDALVALFEEIGACLDWYGDPTTYQGTWGPGTCFSQSSYESPPIEMDQGERARSVRHGPSKKENPS